ncbi:MAG: hypothetical protein Q7U78_00345 [Gallionella sp.]|nr:hypothetical protein [Gallionella sp.]
MEFSNQTKVDDDWTHVTGFGLLGYGIAALVRLAAWALIIGAGLCLWYRRAAVVECQRSAD